MRSGFISTPRRLATAEDWHGIYWWLDFEGGRTTRFLPCPDPSCIVEVEIRSDVLGRWFAEHRTWTSRWEKNPSTVSSPRFEHWQEAAEWALDQGLVES